MNSYSYSGHDSDESSEDWNSFGHTDSYTDSTFYANTKQYMSNTYIQKEVPPNYPYKREDFWWFSDKQYDDIINHWWKVYRGEINEDDIVFRK